MPLIPIIKQIAAELRGQVNIIPTTTAIIILISTGCIFAASLIKFPNETINIFIPGPTRYEISPPKSVTTKGVTIMSIGVFLETSFPTSIPNKEPIYAPTGPPYVAPIAPTTPLENISSLLKKCHSHLPFSVRSMNGLNLGYQEFSSLEDALEA
jgi:hypothetical protein